MPIITVEIMKTKDEREIQKTTKEKKKQSLSKVYISNQVRHIRNKYF